MAYGQFVEQGKIDELTAARSIVAALGGHMEWASPREDIEDHIDLWWSRPEPKYPGLFARVGIDVKGMRRISRHDEALSNTITWLETQNVHGRPGSLYGRATYVAFLRVGKVLLVNRVKLLNFALAKIAGKTIVIDRPNQCYVPYKRARYQRDDVSFMAYLDDIEQLAEHVVPVVSQ